MDIETRKALVRIIDQYDALLRTDGASYERKEWIGNRLGSPIDAARSLLRADAEEQQREAKLRATPWGGWEKATPDYHKQYLAKWAAERDMMSGVALDVWLDANPEPPSDYAEWLIWIANH